MTETMTIRDISELTGKGISTVKGWIRKRSETDQDNGRYSTIMQKLETAQKTKKPARFTYEETIHIINSWNPKLAEVLAQNASFQPPAVPSGNLAILSQYEQITHDIAASVLKKLLPAIHREALSMMHKINKPLLPHSGKSLSDDLKQRELFTPKLTKRKELSSLVNQFAYNHRIKEGVAYTKLYNEMNFRMNINLQVRANNKCLKIIDLIEKENLLDDAIRIIKDMP